jgi:hypothetical protein
VQFKTIKQFFQHFLLFLFDFNTLMTTILLRINYVSNWQDSSHVGCDNSRECHIITESSLFKSVSFALDPVLNWPLYRPKPLTFHRFVLRLSTKKLLLFCILIFMTFSFFTVYSLSFIIYYLSNHLINELVNDNLLRGINIANT